MKKVFISAAILITFVFAQSCLAMNEGWGYGTAGCGLGSMVWGDKPGIMQTCAATTNGTFGSQTFGITSGTSNCDKQPKWTSNERLKEFVASNMDKLAKDVAMGQGESLDTLAELLEIKKDQRAGIYAKLQQNFANIFPSEKVQMADVVDGIMRTLNG